MKRNLNILRTERSVLINGCSKLSLRLNYCEAPLAVWSSRKGCIMNNARRRGRGVVLTLLRLLWPGDEVCVLRTPFRSPPTQEGVAANLWCVSIAPANEVRGPGQRAVRVQDSPLRIISRTVQHCLWTDYIIKTYPALSHMFLKSELSLTSCGVICGSGL